MCGECARAIKEGGRKEMRARYASIIMSMCLGVDVIVFSQGYISVAVVNPHGLTLHVDAAQGITYCILAICAVSNSITK